MNEIKLAQSFIESCESTTTLNELASGFQEVVVKLGFRYYACCSHSDPLRPPDSAIMLHNYPPEWVRIFSERKLYEIDPVYLHAERTLLPFKWDDERFRAKLTAPQREMLEEATGYGLAHGYTVPIHQPWQIGVLRASCSVVPGSEAIDDISYRAVQLMASYLYEAASRHSVQPGPPVKQRILSRRERQCLEYAAQGKSDWVVGRLLGLSPATVHRHMEGAKRRLGVATRVQAVMQALWGRQISFGDIVQVVYIPEPDKKKDPPIRHRVMSSTRVRKKRPKSDK